MFCSQCGNQVAEGSKFCTHCGAPVAAPTPAATPAAEPVVEAVPVATPVAEPVVEAVPVATPVAEPVVEAAPVEAPAAEPAVPVKEPVVIETPVAAPAAEPVPVAAPAAEPVPVAAPAAEPVPVAAPAAEPVPVAAPAAEPVPVAAPVGNPASAATAPEKPKKKKKVWLIILLVVLGVGLLALIIAIIIGAVVISSLRKKLGNGISDFASDMEAKANEYFYEADVVPGSEVVPGSGEEDPIQATLPNQMGINDVVGNVYDGTCRIKSVEGADSLISYLERVSGETMSESEKDSFRSGNVSDGSQFQLFIYDDESADMNGIEYQNGEYLIILPVGFGEEESRVLSFTNYDLLTYDEIDAGLFDKSLIRIENNSFRLKQQIPDEDEEYAGNLLENYADYVSNGSFGTDFSGTIVPGRNGAEFGIDGTYTMMLWYDDMEEPYVITYEYVTDLAGKMSEVLNESGFENDEMDDYDFSEFDNFNFDY